MSLDLIRWDPEVVYSIFDIRIQFFWDGLSENWVSQGSHTTSSVARNVWDYCIASTLSFITWTPIDNSWHHFSHAFSSQHVFVEEFVQDLGSCPNWKDHSTSTPSTIMKLPAYCGWGCKALVQAELQRMPVNAHHTKIFWHNIGTTRRRSRLWSARNLYHLLYLMMSRRLKLLSLEFTYTLLRPMQVYAKLMGVCCWMRGFSCFGDSTLVWKYSNDNWQPERNSFSFSAPKGGTVKNVGFSLEIMQLRALGKS